MQLQPASGARDLNPKQVEINHLLVDSLSNLFRLWGYEKIAPPNIERLETLMADGGIRTKDILKVVADEPLGLRPELTTSIVLAASGRFGNKVRPLRFWSVGTAFKCRESIDRGIDIEENLHCGVELIGVKGIKAEIELLSLLLNTLKVIDIPTKKTTLLIGHKSLMKLILSSFDKRLENKIKNILSNFDLIELQSMDISSTNKDLLKKLIYKRGDPLTIIEDLKIIYGNNEILNNLQNLFRIICPIIEDQNINIQLDPTFETRYELYSGLVFELVSTSITAPVVIASGGRYDELVQKFCKGKDLSSGVGFTYKIDKLRELKNDLLRIEKSTERVLIAYSVNSNYEKALERQRYWHSKGIIAFIENDPFFKKDEALLKLKTTNSTKIDWIA